jgi:glucose/arabinose dehydrogenase
LVSLLFIAPVTATACSGSAADVSSSTPELLTPPTVDELPRGVLAAAWDGRHEPRLIRQEPLPEGYAVETVVTGIANPVGLAFLPDGRILIGEKDTGRIRVVEDGVLRPEPFATVEPLVQGTLELGLLGIAVDPEFAQDHWVYAFYVEADETGAPGRAVIVRFTERDGIGVERTEIAELPATTTDKHNGGGLVFGPDGKLYVTIGDTDRRTEAGDPSIPIGAILRLNRNGPGRQPARRR